MLYVGSAVVILLGRCDDLTCFFFFDMYVPLHRIALILRPRYRNMGFSERDMAEMQRLFGQQGLTRLAVMQLIGFVQLTLSGLNLWSTAAPKGHRVARLSLCH